MYTVQAKNFAQASENRIHSDDIAKRLGFTGALVPGVAVYGHLVHPVANADFLSNSSHSVRFLKPTYDGDWLTITEERDNDSLKVNLCNEAGTLLAVMDVADPNSAQPSFDDSGVFDAVPVDPERKLISWDTIELNRPFDPWQWQATAEENNTYATQVADAQPLYEEYVHPHWILSQANAALMHQFEMPTWIHVGSDVIHHKALHVGDDITVQAAPLEKWRKKGHEFVRLLVHYTRNDEITTQIMHTAIYKVAGT